MVGGPLFWPSCAAASHAGRARTRRKLLGRRAFLRSDYVSRRQDTIWFTGAGAAPVLGRFYRSPACARDLGVVASRLEKGLSAGVQGPQAFRRARAGSGRFQPRQSAGSPTNMPSRFECMRPSSRRRARRCSPSRQCTSQAVRGDSIWPSLGRYTAGHLVCPMLGVPTLTRAPGPSSRRRGAAHLLSRGRGARQHASPS